MKYYLDLLSGDDLSSSDQSETNISVLEQNISMAVLKYRQKWQHLDQQRSVLMTKDMLTTD